MNWFKKSLPILISIGILLLIARPATISRAQGCDPANGVWAGCDIAIAGTGVARNFLCPDGSIDDNSEQIRGEYDNRNSGYGNQFIPTELIFTNDDIINHPSMVQAVLQSHLDNGLFPSIRTWDEVGASDERITQVAQGLTSIVGGLHDLPRSPIVFFGNEPNNWDWPVGDFARQLNAFLEAAGNTYRVFATPMDLYQHPREYWEQVLTIYPDIMSMFDGAAISLYADTVAQAVQLYQQQIDFFHNLGIEIFMLSELGYHGGAQTDPAAFSNFIRAIFPQLAGFEGLELAIIKYWDGQTHLAIVLPNGDVLILDFLCIGGPPTGVGGCADILPGATACCPVTNQKDSDLWGKIGWLAGKFGRTIESMICWVWDRLLPGFDFSIVQTGNPLELSKQVGWDADYNYGSFDRYDDRRIALPDEEPEEGSSFWPGAFFRLAPPGYAHWSEEERDEKLKWEVDLREFKADKPFEGDTPDFAPFNTAASNIWNFLIKTPEPPITGIGNSSPTGEESSTLGISNIPQLTASSNCTTCAQSKSSQTLGIQLANAEEDDVCAQITVGCTATNWVATCHAVAGCSQKCGHVRVHSDLQTVEGSTCFVGGNKCQVGGENTCQFSIPGGSSSWSVAFHGGGDQHGDDWTCIDLVSATCSMSLDDSGSGSCSATAGGDCAPLSPDQSICNPPYSIPPKELCTEPYNQGIPISACEAFKWLIRIVTGRLEVKGYPIFPWAKYIAYYLGGAETGVAGDPGEGGAFEAFLPPGEEPPLIEDAPGTLPLALKVSFSTPCLGVTCDKPCPAGQPEHSTCCNDSAGSETCPRGNGVCDCPKTRCCAPGCTFCDGLRIHFDRTLPIRSDNNLLVSYMGFPTRFLEVVQNWLRPPVWGL